MLRFFPSYRKFFLGKSRSGLNYRVLAGVFDRLEGGYAIDISRGRALYKREVKHKKYNKRRAENPLRRLKTSDDVFRTKTGGFYNQLWENGCRIRTKNQKLQHEPPRRPDYAMFCGRML